MRSRSFRALAGAIVCAAISLLGFLFVRLSKDPEMRELRIPGWFIIVLSPLGVCFQLVRAWLYWRCDQLQKKLSDKNAGEE